MLGLFALLGIGAAVRVRRTATARNAAVVVLALGSIMAVATACSGSAEDGTACSLTDAPNGQVAPAAERVPLDVHAMSKSTLIATPLEQKNLPLRQIPASFAQ